MYLGIDLGTSGVKAVLVDGDQRRDRPGQPQPADVAAAPALVRAGPARTGGAPPRRRSPRSRRAARGSPRCAASGSVGPDARRDAARRRRPRAAAGHPVERRPRPAPNAPSSRRRVPALRARSPATSPCRASPRPSCCGCASTSPTVFGHVARVLLPKDYVRLRLTGETASRHVRRRRHAVARRRAARAGRRRCWPPPA